jgi:MFS family permease
LRGVVDIEKHITARSVSRGGHSLFIVVTLLYWCSLYTYVPILSPYMESIGFSFLMMGIVLGSYGFMQILIRFPLGILSDRLRRRKPFIVVGFVTSALGCLIFILFDGFVGVTVARAMTGISASAWVAFTVLYASYYVGNEATKAMGTISVATVTGQLIGMGVSGVVAEKWGWASTFWIGGVFALIGGAICWFVYESKEGVYRPPMQFRDIPPIIGHPILLKVSVLSVLAHSVLFITMFGFTPSYAISIGADKLYLSMLVIVFMVPHAFASLISGKRIAPRYGIWPTIVSGFIISGICTALIPFYHSLTLLLLTQAINGFAQGLHLPLFMGLSIQSIDNEKRATAMGFYQSVYAAGMFGGPFIAGWLNESFGLSGGFTFGAIVGLFAAILTAYWGYRSKR